MLYSVVADLSNYSKNCTHVERKKCVHNFSQESSG